MQTKAMPSHARESLRVFPKEYAIARSAHAVYRLSVRVLSERDSRARRRMRLRILAKWYHPSTRQGDSNREADSVAS